MHTTWETLGCTDNKNNCDEKNIQTESMKCNSMLCNQNSKKYDTTIALDNSGSYLSSYHDRNTPCMLCFIVFFVIIKIKILNIYFLFLGHQSIIDNRSSIDRWLNRSCLIPSTKREELLNDARRAYRLYGLCSSDNFINDECSQGFILTNQGHDIGHIIIIYDNIKKLYSYTFLFTNDYENIFLKESKLKCMIYGTGRKSSKCRNISLIDLNEYNPKHNMTWWRDPSTLYEHLKELIEIMNYEKLQNNQTELNNNNNNNLYEKYFSDQYILSKEFQDKYLLNNNNNINFDKNDCKNKSNILFTLYLSTWISPQTKNIYLNYTFFKQLKKDNFDLNEPICSYPNIEQINTTKNIQLIDYIIKKVKNNLNLYRSETILKPILLNLLFEKNPIMINREGIFTRGNFLINHFCFFFLFFS